MPSTTYTCKYTLGQYTAEYAFDSDTTANVVLLESGDYVLLESGDLLLLG